MTGKENRARVGRVRRIAGAYGIVCRGAGWLVVGRMGDGWQVFARGLTKPAAAAECCRLARAEAADKMAVQKGA